MHDNGKSLVHKQTSNYGKVIVTLKDYLDKNNISKNSVVQRANVTYKVLNHLYQTENIERVDLDVLARICYILDCELSDLITYQKPE